MKEVLLYKNYTSIGDVCAVAVCVICWVLAGSTYIIKQKNLRIFHLSNLLVCVASICSIIYHTLIGKMQASTVMWVYFFRSVSYVSLILTLVLFVTYLENFVQLSEGKRRLVSTLKYVGVLFYVSFEIAAPMTKLGFYIDDNLNISQNYHWHVFCACCIFYVGIKLAIMNVKKKKFITRIYQCIRNVMLISVLFIVIQSYYQSTSLLCITFVFPILEALFVVHYNAFDAETGTLDAKAFYGYINELRNSKFTMIYLHLKEPKPEKMQDLAEEFYHFNEKYFKKPYTFHIRDNQMILIIQDCNRADEKIPILLEDFAKLYDKYQMDFKIIITQSYDSMTSGQEYIQLVEFVEEKVELNTVYLCQEKDVEAYKRAAYILSELRDIHEKDDLNDERVLVYCQPVLNTQTNAFTTAEALMRLKIPEIGLVFPEQFIPLAEKYDLIHSLSKIILNKTCKQMKMLEKKGYFMERISVNFSVRELRDKNFCQDVMEIIEKNGIEYQKIGIELTESKNERDFENMKNVMDKLRSHGMKFYLDDFGTGYSNFERIIGLPIDTIKFDRSLTLLAGKDEESKYMVGSFSDIFKKSHYQVLFEGIEDEEDEQRCQEMQANYLQGFKYSKPIPIEQLEDFVPKKAPSN